MRADATSSLHIFTLSSFAIAQPLFDLLSRNAAFFVVRRSEPLDILILCVLVCVALPLCLILIEKGLGWTAPKMGTWARAGIIGALVALLILQGLRQIPALPGTISILGAVASATLVVWSYTRSAPVRLFFSLLSPGLFLFPTIFLFFSPVSKLMFPEAVAVAKPQQPAEPVPIVMVIFDELPLYSLLNDKLEIDSARFPHLAAFSQEATWFRNATTVSIQTTLSVPAILTGNYPSVGRMPTAADHPYNLFTLLESSHDLKVFESLTQLCPEQLCQNGIFPPAPLRARLQALISDVSAVLLHLVLPQDWRGRLPDITQTWMNFVADIPHSASDVTTTALFRGRQNIPPQRPQPPPRRFGDFIEMIQGKERPTLYFAHILLPHIPYVWLPSGKRYNSQTAMPGLIAGRWLDDELAISQGYQRYLSQVGLVDTLIGRLVSRLKTEGLYDRSLIVFTADHGASFRPNQPRRVLTESNAPDIMRVPLFVKAPYQQERVINDRNVETVDIIPTVSDLLHVSPPWAVDGHSAFDPVRPEKKDKIIFAGDRYVFDGRFPPEQHRKNRPRLGFGLEGRPDEPQDLQPYRALVGQQVSRFQLKEDSAMTITIDRSDLFSRIDLSSDFVPAYITGTIHLDGTRQFSPFIALALNGRIRSITRPWDFPVQGRLGAWAALVDESTFRAGRNNVEAFAVSSEAGRFALTRGTGIFEQQPVHLHGREETIISPEGKPTAVSARTLRGSVDHAGVTDGQIEIFGWAADMKNARPPQAIWVYVDDQFFHAGQTSVTRLDVVRALNNAALRTTGFHYTFPLTRFADMTEVKIRVFAVSQDKEVAEVSTLPIEIAVAEHLARPSR